MKLVDLSEICFVSKRLFTYFVILSSMDRSSRMKVGRVILERSAPGRSWEMIWESTELSAVASSRCPDSLPLFCSESTMVSSWSVSRVSSVEDRLPAARHYAVCLTSQVWMPTFKRVASGSQSTAK